jgi:pseudaminic acid biosynthesis-associated methylase
MNAQEQFWAGSFGDEYTARNRVDWRARIPFWSMILDVTGARSVYEFGCNAGWNLSAIRRCYPDVRAIGVDINPRAVAQAQTADLYVALANDLAGEAELVFTAGVLIHVAPDALQKTMQMIIEASYDYVLAVEYPSVSKGVEALVYRGNEDRLWRRAYGHLYEQMGLKCIAEGPAGKGFDNCRYWLMRKP